MENNFKEIRNLFTETLVWNDEHNKYDTIPWDFETALKLIKANAKKGIYTPLENDWEMVYNMADHDLEKESNVFVSDYYSDIKAANEIINFYKTKFSSEYDYLEGAIFSGFIQDSTEPMSKIYFDGIIKKLRNTYNDKKNFHEIELQMRKADDYAVKFYNFILPRFVFYSAIKVACPSSIYSKSIKDLNSTINVDPEGKESHPARKERHHVDSSILESTNFVAKRPVDEIYQFERFEKDFDYFVEYLFKKFNIIVDAKIITLIGCDFASPFGKDTRALNKVFYPDKDYELKKWYEKHSKFKLPIDDKEIFTSLEKYIEFVK